MEEFPKVPDVEKMLEDVEKMFGGVRVANRRQSLLAAASRVYAAEIASGQLPARARSAVEAALVMEDIILSRTGAMVNSWPLDAAAGPQRRDDV